MVKKDKKEEIVKEKPVLTKKDLKKVTKLESKIPYFIGLRQDAEAEKIKDQIEAIWEKARVDQGLI